MNFVWSEFGPHRRAKVGVCERVWQLLEAQGMFGSRICMGGCWADLWNTRESKSSDLKPQPLNREHKYAAFSVWESCWRQGPWVSSFMSARNQFEGSLLVLTSDLWGQLFVLCQDVTRHMNLPCCWYFILVLCSFRISCRCWSPWKNHPTLNTSKGQSKGKGDWAKSLHTVRRVEFVVLRCWGLNSDLTHVREILYHWTCWRARVAPSSLIYLKQGTLSVARTSLEIPVWTRLSLNLQFFLCLLSSVITGMCKIPSPTESGNSMLFVWCLGDLADRNPQAKFGSSFLITFKNSEYSSCSLMLLDRAFARTLFLL